MTVMKNRRRCSTGLIAFAAVVLAVPGAARAAKDDLDPPARAHLQLWLRADTGVEQSGGKITVWRDQSGQSNDAKASGKTAPALDATGLREGPAVCFDGVDDHMSIAHRPELNADDGLTVICVYRYTDGFRILQKKDDDHGLTPDSWFLSPGAGLGVAGHYPKSRYFPRRPVFLQSSVYDPASGTIRVFSNGQPTAQLEDVPQARPNTDPLYVGKRHLPKATQGHLKGCIAELLVYNAALPDADRKQIEQALRKTYRVISYGQETLKVSRVIPGNRQVTVEWRRPEKVDAASNLHYVVEVKHRHAPWTQAVRRERSASARSATMTDLLNHADYALRVWAQQDGSQKPLAESAERLVSPADVPGIVIDYVHKDETFYMNKGVYIGSPSIARLPDGRFLASHDLFGCGSHDVSRIFRSNDGGRTWRHVSDLEQCFWGKLFVHREKLYMLACSRRFGDIVIRRSPDSGKTWTDPAVIVKGLCHKAPVPLKVHRGRLWTCVEYKDPAFRAMVISAPVEADLMQPSNWTVSEPLSYDPNWAPKGWTPKRGHISEGNAVVDPQGNLLNVLRYNPPPHYGKAVVLDIPDDGRSLSFNRTMDFPGSLTKFTIRRHPETGVYWSLVNRVPKPRNGMWACRNVLSLVQSDDFEHWAPVCDVLRDDREFAPKYTGFQYIDWLFDGDDIVYVCRMGYNGAHNFHDANHLTFHRIKDYAKRRPSYGP